MFVNLSLSIYITISILTRYDNNKKTTTFTRLTLSLRTLRYALIKHSTLSHQHTKKHFLWKYVWKSFSLSLYIYISHSHTQQSLLCSLSFSEISNRETEKLNAKPSPHNPRKRTVDFTYFSLSLSLSLSLCVVLWNRIFEEKSRIFVTYNIDYRL